MARMKFLMDVSRCINCDGCTVACKNTNHVPWGMHRRRVVTINEGKPGERSLSVACMHCTKAPCISVCPVDVIYEREDGVVLHDKEGCIGCGYCLWACPFGAPQFPESAPFGSRGGMDKCTFCAGGPVEDFSSEEREKYGANRVGEGKLPSCASMCATKALLSGDSDKISEIFRNRIANRGAGGGTWGWNIAYGKK